MSDRYVSAAEKAYWGNDDQDAPQAEHIEKWASNLASKFMAEAEASFDKQFGDYGDYDRKAVDFTSLVDQLTDAARDALRERY